MTPPTLYVVDDDTTPMTPGMYCISFRVPSQATPPFSSWVQTAFEAVIRGCALNGTVVESRYRVSKGLPFDGRLHDLHVLMVQQAVEDRNAALLKEAGLLWPTH